MLKFITAGDTAIRIYDTRKEGPAVVFLHGYLESLDVWDNFFGLLPDHWRIIAPDIPGHGISAVKYPVITMEYAAGVIRSAVKELGVDRYIIVGHSMGGYVALELLRQFPDDIKGIVLFHSTPNPDTDEKKEARDREIAIVKGGKKDLLAAAVDIGFASDNRGRFGWFISELQDQVYLTEESGIIGILEGMKARRDNNPTLAGSDVPQMFIFGMKDDHISVVTARALADKHPTAIVIWLENSGHMGFVEEPEKSAESLTDFVNGLSH